ncbi:MAG TPA: hypothetical protein VKW76_12265 [Candidatus Binatia bacterium]|nr:hypothetical protein [Candidatus Binatia bacterium]
MKVRIALQPIAAVVLAVRAGLRDARACRPAYFWAMVLHPLRRGTLAREGWDDIAKVFVIALGIDGIYQLAVLRWLYPGEAVVVAVTLALLPYALIRGLTNRAVRPWLGRFPARPGADLGR